MLRSLLTPWRALFLVGFILMALGGPRHPGGTMAEMLAHPDWVISHLLVLGAFVALLIGLQFFARSGDLPARTRRWVRLAIGGTALMAFEMAVHTAATVDHGALIAGEPTPVLTAHLAMSILFYPVFSITLIGLLVAGMRDRVLGSPWIVWLGIAGLAAHGAAPALVVGLGLPQARILFPMVMLLGLWMALAAVWPVRRPVGAPSPAAGVAVA